MWLQPIDFNIDKLFILIPSDNLDALEQMQAQMAQSAAQEQAAKAQGEALDNAAKAQELNQDITL